MPDYSNQFQLHSSVVANGNFDSSANWTVVAGEGISFTGGRLVSDGNGRNVVQQQVSGLNDGDTCLLMVEVTSGEGICSFGDRGIGLSSGTHCVFCTADINMLLTFDFEDVAAQIESVRLRKAVFAS